MTHKLSPMHNLFSTWRALWKNRSITIINLTGLSVGMAAAVLIMLWVQNEISYDSYHADAARIYRITKYTQVSSGDGNTWINETTPYVFASEAQKKLPEIEGTARLMDRSRNAFVFQVNGELFKEQSCAQVDSNWFNLFHYEVVTGNLQVFSQVPNSIALTETKAKKYFGNKNAVGRLIQIDSTQFTVRAILKDNPANSSFQYDILLPISTYYATAQNVREMNYWGVSSVMTFLKLRKDANQAMVEQKLTALYQDNLKSFSKRSKETWSKLTPLSGMHFETELQQSAIRHIDKKTVTIFSILAILILLTACINYVNLTTARASMRAKEVSIRKIAGAAKWQLFRQFIIESCMISAGSLALALLLVQVSLPFFNVLMDTHITLSLSSVQLWQILLGTLVFTTLMNGIYPALLLSSFQPLSVFRGITILKVKDVYFRKSLVVTQFCISAILITGTIVIFQQMRYIQRANNGYNKAQVFNIRVPLDAFRKLPARGEQMFVVRSMENSFLENLKTDLQKESSIASVSIAQTDIIDTHTQSSGGYDWNGKPENYDPSISGLSVDADFPKMFHLELKEGRWFRDHDKGDEKVFVLNETAVSELNIHQPVIGQRFIHESDTGTIIGVAKDFNFQSMHDKIGPLVMFNRPYWRQNMYIQIQPGQSENALRVVKAKWKTLFPTNPFEYNFLDEAFDKLYRADRKTSYLVLVFSVIAVLISAMGLFGLTAFSAERRIKEIGIRKVLGANIKDIVALLSKEFVFLVSISIAIATPTAWILMNKWLANFAYRININVWMLLTAGILAMCIALLTVCLQAIKAAKANPVKSLRTE